MMFDLSHTRLVQPLAHYLSLGLLCQGILPRVQRGTCDVFYLNKVAVDDYGMESARR